MTILPSLSIPEELLARIKERFEVNPDVKVEEEIYHFANTVFDYSTNEIRTGNSKTLVTSRQAEILRILARNPNVAIDREIILSAVWGNVSYANSLALNVQVTYLRKALRNDPLTSIVSLTKKWLYAERIKKACYLCAIEKYRQIKNAYEFQRKVLPGI